MAFNVSPGVTLLTMVNQPPDMEVFPEDLINNLGHGHFLFLGQAVEDRNKVSPDLWAIDNLSPFNIKLMTFSVSDITLRQAVKLVISTSSA